MRDVCVRHVPRDVAALQAAGVGTRGEQLAMSSWFCWAVPLLIVETVLQGRRICRLDGALDANIASAGIEPVGGWLQSPRGEPERRARFITAGFPHRRLARAAEPQRHGQAGTVRHLEPQVMDLLAFLASTGGRVVSKDEIIDAVWEGRFIAEATLTRSIADLRRALGDDQRRPQYIETIPKRGYRLVRDRFPPAVMVSADHVANRRPRAKSPNARGRIADRLASARRSRFVGRAAEIENFRAALLADELPFVVLRLGGAGGVGKTSAARTSSRAWQRSGPHGGAHRRPQHRTVAGRIPRRAEPGDRR